MRTEADPLVALLTRMAIALRGSAAVFVTAAALLSVTESHPLGATIAALVIYDLVTVGYVLAVRNHGLVPALIVADVLVVSCLALAMRWLVPAESATSPAGWVFNAVSLVVIVTQFGGRPQWTVPTAVVAICAFVAGAAIADAPGGLVAVFTLVLQVAIAAGLIAILRAAGRQARTAEQEYHDAAREQEAARLRRDAERTQSTLLHNGPLTTLSLVSQGGLSRDGIAGVRGQAAVDLAMLGGRGSSAFADDPTGRVGVPGPRVGSGAGGVPGPRIGHRVSDDTDDSVQLADLLDRTVAIIRHRLHVRLTTSRCLVPPPVAQALAGATAEALENVARHAGTDSATVHLDAGDEHVTITITDTGRGFDPAAVPTNRFGLRESITGQLNRIGGTAAIASRPERGTTITVRWPA